MIPFIDDQWKFRIAQQIVDKRFCWHATVGNPGIGAVAEVESLRAYKSKSYCRKKIHQFITINNISKWNIVRSKYGTRLRKVVE